MKMIKKNKTPKYLREFNSRVDEITPNDDLTKLNELKKEIYYKDKTHRARLKRLWIASSIAGFTMVITSMSYIGLQKEKNKEEFYATIPGIEYSKISSDLSNLYDIKEELNKSSQKYTKSLQELNEISQPEEIKKENRELSTLVSSQTTDISKDLTDKISEYNARLDPIKNTHEYLQFDKKNKRAKILFLFAYTSGLSLYLLGIKKAQKYESKYTSDEADELILKANINHSISKNNA